MEDIAQRVLMFFVGAIFVIGSVKFIIAALDSPRGALPAVGMGVLGFVIGLCLAVWSFTGPPG